MIDKDKPPPPSPQLPHLKCHKRTTAKKNTAQRAPRTGARTETEPWLFPSPQSVVGDRTGIGTQTEMHTTSPLPCPPTHQVRVETTMGTGTATPLVTTTAAGTDVMTTHPRRHQPLEAAAAMTIMTGSDSAIGDQPADIPMPLTGHHPGGGSLAHKCTNKSTQKPMYP